MCGSDGPLDHYNNTATGACKGVNGQALNGLDLSGTTHTAAGTYTDGWSFTDSTGNYKNASGTLTDKISKVDPDCSSISGYDVPFDGNAHTATGSCKGVNGKALNGLDLSGTTHTAAGTYTDGWSFTDSTGNYKNASGTLTDKISKVDPDCSSISGNNVPYDKSADTASRRFNNINGQALNGLDLSGTTHTAAGTYTDGWSFTDSTGNYKNASGTLTDKISKVDPDCSSISGYDVPFDGNAHTATGSCKGVNGKALNGLDLSGTTHTAAGTYTDGWSFTDSTGNYKNASGTLTDKISKVDPDCSSISGYDVPFDGNAHTATGSCKGVNGKALNGLDLSGTTHTAAGTYTDGWSFTDSTGNYKNASGTLTDKISKVDPDCSSISGYDVPFDGNAHTATGACKGVNGQALNGLDLSGTTHSHAGTYTDGWSFTDSTGNYKNASGTVTDKISKVDPDCSSISGYDVPFDGNAHTATGSCKGVNGKALNGLDLSGTTHTAAGTYTDGWSFTDSTGNYKNASGTLTDKISKVDPDCSSISGYDVPFDGNAHTATGACKGVNGQALNGLDLSGTTHTAAGTYTVGWSFTDSTGNYKNASGTVTDKISKVDPDCSSISGYDVPFDGNAHTATGACKGVNG